MTSKLTVVKLLHSEKAGDSSIGAWQIRLALVSLIPLSVGHVRFGCSGDDGRLTLDGWTMSLSEMMIFVSFIVLLCNNSQTELQFRQKYKHGIKTACMFSSLNGL